MEMSWLLVCMLAVLCGVNCDIYNVVMPTYLPPAGCKKCADWEHNIWTNDESIWGVGGFPKGIGNSCAMPALLNGNQFDNNTVNSSYSGPWCVCDASGVEGTCVAPLFTPEQINLQLASSSVLVVSFVTYEGKHPSTKPPVAKLTKEGGPVVQVNL